MTSHELFDRIQTWNILFDQMPLPPATNPDVDKIRIEVERQWDNGMLLNASELEMVRDLLGSSVENDLKTAITYAKSFDRSKLQDVHTLLLKVQKYMFQSHLT